MWRSINQLLGRQNHRHQATAQSIGVILQNVSWWHSFFYSGCQWADLYYEPKRLQLFIFWPWSAPMWLLKDCADEVASDITKLFNLSLSNGVVPATVYCRKLTWMKRSNFRPISNLATLEKLLFCCNNLYPESVSAYRQHRNTETELVSFLLLIMITLYYFQWYHYDLSSAFDTVLLKRLSNVRISVSSIIMDDILSGRSQSVSFGGSISKDLNSLLWCSTGLCIGPTPVYFADAEKLIHSLDYLVHLYADDAEQ